MPEEPEGEEAEEQHGLIATLRERLISVRTMDRRVQVVTAVVAIQGLLVAAMLVLGKSNLPQIDITTVSDRLVTMPVAIWIACLLFLVLAWTYMLAGATHGHPILRLAAASLFTYSTISVTTIAAQTTTWSHLLATGCVAALWVLTIGVLVLDWWRDRAGHPGPRHRHQLKGVTFTLTLLLVAGVFGGTYLGDVRSGAPLLFSEAVYIHFQVLTNFLIPMLVLTAVDFTEIGLVGSEWVAARAAGFGSAMVPAAAAFLAAAGVLAVSVWGGVSVGVTFEVLGYALVAVLLIGWLVTRAASPLLKSHRIPYSAVAGAAVAAFAVQFLTLNVLIPGLIPKPDPNALPVNLTTYDHPTTPVFSIKYPSTWHVTATEATKPGAASVYDYSGLQSGTPAAWEIISLTGLDVAAGPEKFGLQFIKGFRAVPAGSWTVSDGWHRLDYTSGATIRGTVWARFIGGRFWGQTGFSSNKLYPVERRVFDAMAASWAPAAQPAEAAPESLSQVVTRVARDVSAGEGVFWLLVAIVAGAALIVFRRRKLPPALPAGLLFIAVFGLFLFGLDLNSLAQVVADRTGHTLGAYPHGIGSYGWKLSAAVFSLLFVAAWLTVGRRSRSWVPALRAIVILNLGLQLVTWMYDGYTAEIDASGRFSLIAALVVLLALTWDVAMSGESITNRHSDWFPRHSRVAIYLGYEMLVSTSVLFFSSLHFQASGAAVKAQFESDSWPQFGLAELGVPLVVGLFALQMIKWASGLGAEPEDQSQDEVEQAPPELLVGA